MIRTLDASLSLPSGAPVLRRKCACESSGQSCNQCRKKEEEKLRRKSDSPATQAVAPPIVHQVLSSSGRALDKVTRDYFEPRFGYDFSGVRIHADAPAAESARAVSALAYTVGNKIAFAAGQYAPRSSEGRRLLAHELAHVVQQSAASPRISSESGIFSDPSGQSRNETAASALQAGAMPGLAGNPSRLQPFRTPVLRRTGGPYDKLSIEQLRKMVLTDPEAAEALRLRYRAMANVELERYTRGNDAIAKSEYAKRTVTPEDAQGQGPFSKREVLDTLKDDIKQQRAAGGIARRAPNAVTPEGHTEGGTIGAARTDIPGLENHVFVGRSPQAGGQVNPKSNFPPATDPKVLPQTHGHAEQDIADQLEKALSGIPKEQLKGRRVWMLIEQEPCSTCAQGVSEPGIAPGVLAKLRERFPEVTFEVKNLDSRALMVLKGGTGSGPKGGSGGPGNPEGEGGEGGTVEGGSVAGGKGSATPAKPPVAGGAGEEESAPGATGLAGVKPGRFTGVGIGIGSAAISLGIGLLSSYLKARVDQKIAEGQINRNQAKAEQIINQQVDTILKMMLTNPEQTLYARVFMSSSVISTRDVNNPSPEPVMNNSSPIIDLTGVGFTFDPLDPALSDTYQGFSGGGTHITTRRLLVSEIPLVTPPIEDLIAFARARKLPLDELRIFVLKRLAGADEKSGPNAFIKTVNRWKHLLDLIDQATAASKQEEAAQEKAKEQRREQGRKDRAAAEEKRRQENFDRAQQQQAAAANAPPEQQLLPPPGQAQQAQQVPAGSDPFGLFGPTTPQPLNGISVENAELAGTGFGRARRRLLARYQQLDSAHFPSDEVAKYQSDVAEYVSSLDKIVAAFKKDGSSAWPGVQEMMRLRDAADNEDRSKLMR